MFGKKKIVSLLLSLFVLVGLISPSISDAIQIEPDIGFTITVTSDENGTIKEDEDSEILVEDEDVKFTEVEEKIKSKVKPSEFYEFEKIVRIGESNGGQSEETELKDDDIISEDTEVKVIHKLKDISGPYSEEDLKEVDIPEDLVKVIFTEGKYGKIKGNNILLVKKGIKLEDIDRESIPKVLPNKGYKHIGWKKLEPYANDDDIVTFTKFLKLKIGEKEKDEIVNEDTTLEAIYRRASSPIRVPDEEKEIENHKLYIIGYKDGEFKPGNGITRAEVAAIFSRLLESKVDFSAKDTDFSDVNSEHWASGYIDYLVKKDIIKGRDDGKYYPEDEISRAEMAQVIANLKELKPEKIEENEFTDIVGHWAEESIIAATEEGIIDGYGNEYFKPDKSVSRSEAVKMTNRAFNRSGDKKFIEENLEEKGMFPDVSELNWAYTDVYEAALSHEFIREDDNSEKWLKITEMGRVIGMNK